MKRERDEDLVEAFFAIASHRWGEEEAIVLRSALERTAEAISDVERSELDPSDEPWRPPRKA
jgi:hypothetical protein